MIVFPEKLLVIETTLLPINVTLAERQPLCLIFGPQDVGAYLLRILHWTKKRIYLYSRFGANHLQIPHLLNFAQFCHMT